MPFKKGYKRLWIQARWKCVEPAHLSVCERHKAKSERNSGETEDVVAVKR
jgi:hypothetical protein